MSLAYKMLQGGSTPVLYDFYGKLYDYNDLAQAADLGLNEYLSTLKRGDKDLDDFRNAYANIMSGIKDGTITFSDGKFHDSEGRYTNSDKKSKDYYGLIANYIYNKMGKSNEYKKPEDTSKIAWQDDSVKTALMRLLFNSDSGNIADFLDLDEEKNGVRSIANRSTYLSNAFQHIADNWDNTFQGYSDADKLRYIPLLQNAAQVLRDGKINPGDYLALSNAVGGMDFREMLATGTPSATVAPSVAQQLNTIGNTVEQGLGENSKYVIPKMKHASLIDSNYNLDTLNRMTSIMSKVPTNGLINILRNSFYNRNYRFGNDPRISKIFGSSNISSKAGVTATLNALQAQGVLQKADSSNPNLYYIPGLLTKYGTAWVWDKAHNTITEMSAGNIPFVILHSTIQYKENGGIIKALQGAKLPWYNGLNDYDVNNYKTNWGNTLYGINDKGIYGEAYGNNGIGMNDYRYKTDSRFSDYSLKGKDYASAVEEQLNYKNFTNELIKSANEYTDATDKSTFNDDNNVFLKWSHLVDKTLPSKSKSTFFDENGNIRSSWEVTNKDSYNRGPRQPITSLSDYITSIRNDLLLANRHNDLMKEGTRYFYTDENKNKHWVDPEIAKSGKYQVSTNGIKSVDGITNWTDYELTGNNLNNSDKTGTDIDRTDAPLKKPSWISQNGEKIYDKLAPLAVGAGRLYDSIHSNNKIAKEVKKSIKPVLKNTYELYSPVTGAFSEMQFRNRQAADLRRLGSEQYTSDASLNSARLLDANSQANNLQYQGFLADDKEIKRTLQEALKRQEDNIARRTDVANFNRASINLTNRELAQLEASRLKSNWQSRDNYLSGIESDIKNRIAQKESDRRYELYLNKQQSLSLDANDLTRKYDIKTRNINNTYNDLLTDLKSEFNAKLAAWLKVNGADADYTSEPFYKDFIEKARALRNQNYQNLDQIEEERSQDFRNYINSLRDKANQSSLFKRGGKLSLSTINLLHKVMN